MKDQAEGDRAVRKSNRQRVPNAFYTEGINQLKRAPRPARDPPSKQSRKRSAAYQDDFDSQAEGIEEERSEVVTGKEANDWLSCRLPKNGITMKVQFVVQQPEEPQIDRKKEEPAKAKKVDTSFDLLSLFQKAIENVNEEELPEKSPENQPQPTINRDPKMKKEFSVPKQKRVEDMEGRITAVKMDGDRILITHSKIGQSEFAVIHSGEMEEETLLRTEAEQYRQRLAGCGILNQITILNPY